MHKPSLPSRNSPDWPVLALAAAWLAGVGAGYWVFIRTRWGQAVDGSGMAHFSELTPLHEVARLAGTVSVTTLVVGMVLAAIAGLARRRWWLALGAAAAIGTAMVVTELLKEWVLPRPDFRIGWSLANSYPSGHATAVTVVTLVALVTMPRSWRRYFLPVAVGVPPLLGAGLVALEWHRASDVAAACAVATACVLVALSLAGGPVARERAAWARTTPGRGVPFGEGWPRGWSLRLGVAGLAALGAAVGCGWLTRAAWDEQSAEFLVDDISTASLGAADVAIFGLSACLILAAGLGSVASVLWAADRAKV
ncbi:phosphatase PAP2 family protein [Buchananella hordeovulneris]|uniref:phosphatase PAP2 family protein n=1 Tax=Buchananella hordeovulneris TaxID=52770 RepID=UPI0026DBCBF9|nr:phosphatase PAP2 family protein [Buchananella hordeovulneris]MDO5080833.1 phosphatase PAP2 family protein [Buchananella hordeovulneris]